MCRPSVRCAVAGLALAALLALAAPAGAASLRPTVGLSPLALWSGAWSWFTNLWTERSIAEPAAMPQASSKMVPGNSPPPPPKPTSAGNRGGKGDQGPGVDPDG
jgi:hypothetical protein